MAGLKTILPTRNTKCPWQWVGENTGGDVFWCDRCGCVIDEDGENLRTANYDDTILCPDQGRVP